MINPRQSPSLPGAIAAPTPRTDRRPVDRPAARAGVIAIFMVVVSALIGAVSPLAAQAATAPKPAAGLNGLKLVNYYPASAAWTYMWQAWNPVQIDKDFATIASWSANGVRLVVQPSAVGWPVPTPAMEAEVVQGVALAQAHGLRVELTLFDWWGSYQDQAGSDRWTQAVLAPFRNDARIAFVELQNEIRPENPSAMAWARHELPVVRQAAGNIPVTVSVTDNPQFTVLQELKALKTALSATPPDFYDVHLYGNPGAAYATLAEAKALVAPAPLYIGEVGVSSYATGSAAATPLAEAQQDQFFRTVAWATGQLGLPAAAPWTMQDFTPRGVPAQAGLPASGYQFGLLRSDGTPKPAVATIKSLFTTQSASTDFNAGFETAAGGLPTVWQLIRPAQGTFAWDPTVAHSGQASVRLSHTTGDNTGTPAFAANPVIGPTRAGQQFDASVWSKGAAATGTTTIAVSWFDTANRYLGGIDSAALPTGTTGWTRLSVVATAPLNAAYAQVYLKSANNTGTVWFDDVTFDPYILAVANAGFGDGGASAPASWQPEHPTEGTLAWSPTVGHSGPGSVSLSRTTGDSTGSPAFSIVPAISPMRTGDAFEAAVWAKGDATTGTNNLTIAWFDASNRVLGVDSSLPLPGGSADWTRLAAQTLVPANAAYARINVRSAGNTGTVWFDDVTLTPNVTRVYNAGFEQGADSAPAGWQSYRANQGTLVRDTTVAHSGQASVRLSHTTGDSTGTPAFFTTPLVSPLRAGQHFQATAWATGSAATGANTLAVSWFDSSNTYLGAAVAAPLPTGTSPWTLLSVSATAPTGAAYAQLYLKSAANSGSVWFDDVTLTALD